MKLFFSCAVILLNISILGMEKEIDIWTKPQTESQKRTLALFKSVYNLPEKTCNQIMVLAGCRPKNNGYLVITKGSYSFNTPDHLYVVSDYYGNSKLPLLAILIKNIKPKKFSEDPFIDLLMRRHSKETYDFSWRTSTGYHSQMAFTTNKTIICTASGPNKKKTSVASFYRERSSCSGYYSYLFLSMANNPVIKKRIKEKITALTLDNKNNVIISTKLKKPKEPLVNWVPYKINFYKISSSGWFRPHASGILPEKFISLCFISERTALGLSSEGTLYGIAIHTDKSITCHAQTIKDIKGKELSIEKIAVNKNFPNQIAFSTYNKLYVAYLNEYHPQNKMVFHFIDKINIPTRYITLGGQDHNKLWFEKKYIYYQDEHSTDSSKLRIYKYKVINLPPPTITAQ